MAVPGGEILQRPTPVILMLDSERPRGGGRQRRVTPAPRLDGRLLVGREHVFVGPQGAPLERAVVEIEDHAGFALEGGVPGEDPAPVLPGLDGILRQPAPDGGVGDGGHEAARNRLGANIGNVQARQRAQPNVAGTSQASALTSTTTPGGKDRGPPVSGPFL